jgi:hypothetical protein
MTAYADPSVYFAWWKLRHFLVQNLAAADFQKLCNDINESLWDLLQPEPPPTMAFDVKPRRKDLDYMLELINRYTRGEFSAEQNKILIACGRELSEAQRGSKTGYPGRPPKAADLINREFERRCREEVLKLNLNALAKDLLDWLMVTHPTEERPTVGTIENNIRDRYRKAVKNPRN